MKSTATIDIVGFAEIAQGNSPLVGIIANPVSARDIRRVIANASSLQIADRANIVLRVLACLRACGIGDVVMMPENGGIGRHVDRGLARARNLGEQQFPNVHYLPMRVGGTVDDTHQATKAMVRAGVAAIVVLGGDGTHRGRRMDPEQQDEQRCHERPAADPRHPHQQATDKPADRVQRIYRMHGRLPPLGNVATEKGYATISAL